MTLALYNTLTRRKEAFAPLDPNGKAVKMYCCGVTVYDYCHLGHARSYIVWDTVRRYLQWRGYDVRYVQNFTDIDDKIINRAKEQGKSWTEITETFIQAYHEDMGQLNILPADAYPKATETIPQMIAIIEGLIAAGYAYPTTDGDVYYAVQRFPVYGKLSGRSLDQMEAGASGRVEEETSKRHPLDFALWKAAKPGEPEWDSPWGKGRPGWHIECSAMVKETLGTEIDIHVGGSDLIFPHHENEIAQSEAVTTRQLARYWMHNGFVKIQGEKMSKSLQNFRTIRDLLQVYPDPMILRLFVLQAHYRQPIDFSEEAMNSAQNSWETLKEGLMFGYHVAEKLSWDLKEPIFGDPEKLSTPENEWVDRFRAAMDDDFNTSGAFVVLFELAKTLSRSQNVLMHGGQVETDSETLKTQWQTLVTLSAVLGLKADPNATAGDATDSNAAGLPDAEIENLIQQRVAARKAKNWAESDRIRDTLADRGIKLIDHKDGTTTWIREG